MGRDMEGGKEGGGGREGGREAGREGGREGGREMHNGKLQDASDQVHYLGAPGLQYRSTPFLMYVMAIHLTLGSTPLSLITL